MSMSVIFLRVDKIYKIAQNYQTVFSIFLPTLYNVYYLEK